MSERDDTWFTWFLVLALIVGGLALFVYGDHQLISRLQQRVATLESERR